MKKFKPTLLTLLLFIGNFCLLHAQSPVGKNLHEVIGLRGENFKRLTDAQGLHVLQYKRLLAKDTVADLLYFQGFTCVKEESLRPVEQRKLYIDSLNQKYKPAGDNSWMAKDSTFVTIATRDGFLDITSLSAAYYRKIKH
jgi:hypothetical protein